MLFAPKLLFYKIPAPLPARAHTPYHAPSKSLSTPLSNRSCWPARAREISSPCQTLNSQNQAISFASPFPLHHPPRTLTPSKLRVSKRRRRKKWHQCGWRKTIPPSALGCQCPRTVRALDKVNYADCICLVPFYGEAGRPQKLGQRKSEAVGWEGGTAFTPQQRARKTSSMDNFSSVCSTARTHTAHDG